MARMTPLWVPLVIGALGLVGVLLTQILANKRAKDDRADASSRESRRLITEANQRRLDWQREQQRGAYVDFYLALDGMHQSLVDVFDAHGHYLGLSKLLDGSSQRNLLHEQARAREVALGTELSVDYNTLRRAYHSLNLFAPPTVMEPGNDMFIPIVQQYRATHRALTVAPTDLEAPEWNHDAAGRYTNACRADLGMGPLEVHDEDF